MINTRSSGVLQPPCLELVICPWADAKGLLVNTHFVPIKPFLQLLGLHTVAYCRQHLYNTEGSSHTVSLPPCRVLGEWAVDGAIGPPEVELTLALPLGEDQKVGCAPCISTLLPLTWICNQDE